MIEIKRTEAISVIKFEDYPEGSVAYRELMGEHYVKLPFSLDECVYFHIGDFIKVPGLGRFELTKPYSPKYNVESSGFDYVLQLDAHYMKWANKICKYNPEKGASETSFHLTASIETHLNVILRNINALGAKDANFLYEGNPFTFQLSNFPEEKKNLAKYKQYDSTSILNALTDLAQLYECEYWVEDNIIYFGKLELEGESIPFEIDVNVQEMGNTESSKEYANRIIAFGSDKNLPADYRKDSGDVVVNGIAKKCLMLPLSECPYGYIQEDGLTSETEVVEAVIVDETVYPRTQCVVDKVTTYTSTAKDEETGEEITETYYRVTDSSGFNFSTEYILEGETLHIKFESGSLNGMDFECQYNDKEKYYEIVQSEEYGRPLPDATLNPKKGDKFILIGWDSTKIGHTGLVEAAEMELLESARKALKDYKKDPDTHNCVMESDWYEEWMEKEERTYFSFGQKVTLINPALTQNNRVSRIIGFEVKLDIPYDAPEYMVGEAPTYSRSADLQGQIDAITYNGNTYQGNGSGSGVYILTTTSVATETDSNVYSAARTKRDFLSKRENDAARGLITFMQGLISQEVAQLKEGATFGEFVKGLYEGKGGAVDKLGNAEFESLKVRTYMEVLELLVNRLAAIEGDQVFTESDTIEKITLRGFENGYNWTDKENGKTLEQALQNPSEEDRRHAIYELKFREKWEGYFTAQYMGNIVKGIVNTIPAKDGGVSSVDTAERFYTSWMYLTEVDAENNTAIAHLYADEDVPAGVNFPPCEMMNIARWGNINSASEECKKRQSFFYISSDEGVLQHLANVTSPKLENWNYASTFGSLPDFVKNNPDIKDKIVDDDYIYARGLVVQDIIFLDKQGKPKYEIVDRGVWDREVAEQTEYFIDPVTGEHAKDEFGNPIENPNYDPYLHEGKRVGTGAYETHTVYNNGCKWLCLKSYTKEEPRWNSVDWLCIEGVREYTIDPYSSEGVLFSRNSDGDITDLYVEIKFNGEDITEEVLTADGCSMEWVRDSGDEEIDKAWKPEFTDTFKNRIHLVQTAERQDLGVSWKTRRKVTYTARVFVPAGAGIPEQTLEYTFRAKS